MVNLHFSLLPRWRGAAPVERAILAGDRETGVCLMKLEEGLDTGPVYARRVVPIGNDTDLAALRAELVEVGSAASGGVPRRGTGRSSGARAPGRRADHRVQSDARGPAPALGGRRRSQLHRVVRLDRAWTTFRGRRLGILAGERRSEPGADPAPGPRPSGDIGGHVGDHGTGHASCCNGCSRRVVRPWRRRTGPGVCVFRSVSASAATKHGFGDRDSNRGMEP